MSSTKLLKSTSVNSKSQSDTSESDSSSSTVVERLSVELESSSLESVPVKVLPKEQDARSLLRERYLYLLSNICQNRKAVKIQMYENTKVSGNFSAIDRVFENVILENLRTPSVTVDTAIPKAVLRTNDIITMEFERDDTLLSLLKSKLK